MPEQIVHPAAAISARGNTVSVPVARLRIEDCWRESGINHDHVRNLVDLGGRWPPILIHQRDPVVIDGVHRVIAARLLGLERIAASLFLGGPDEALIEFVRRNVYHGLPLTLSERKWAAGRVLTVHPEWSDRRIAEICALSPKTVGRLRPALPERPSEENPHLDTRTRVGRDNKCRAVNGAPARARVIEEIKDRPGASLRAIAASVGVSPETVRTVRMSLDFPPAPGACAVGPPEQAARREDPGPEAGDDRAAVLAWLDRTSVSEDDCVLRVGTVPSGRICEIAEEARRRSDVWLQFALSLDALQQSGLEPSSTAV